MITPKRLVNIILIALSVYIIYLKAPAILTHFKFQDQKAQNFSINKLNGEAFVLHAQSKKVVLVFWATWCGPCEVELKRINEMIMQRKIEPSDILAVSIQEKDSVVRETIKKNNYLFDVAIDSDGSLSTQYQVRATPTVVFIDKNQTIYWMTSGLSPTLEYRISSFLK